MSLSSKLVQILLKAQKDVFSKNIGENNTRYKGDGYDFSELREYESGDDIRHIDWIISSKLSKPYVKIFTQERELNILIAPILSDSLFFGTQKLKKDLVSEICALLSYSSVSQNNPFETYICNEEVKLCTFRSKTNIRVREFIKNLEEYNLLTKSIDYPKIMKGMYEKVKSPSILFLIGDFFDAKELNIQALSSKHEVFVIIVRDRFEENPKAFAKINILDPSLKKSKSISLDEKSITSYTKDLNKADDTLEKSFSKSGVKFVKIYTDENPSTKLISLMSH